MRVSTIYNWGGVGSRHRGWKLGDKPTGTIFFPDIMIWSVYMCYFLLPCIGTSTTTSPAWAKNVND